MKRFRISLTYVASAAAAALAGAWVGSYLTPQGQILPRSPGEVVRLSPHPDPSSAPAVSNPSATSIPELIQVTHPVRRSVLLNQRLDEMDFAGCETALAELMNQPPGRRRDRMITEVCGRMGEIDGPRAVVVADALIGPQPREEALAAALGSWAESSPEAAWPWFTESLPPAGSQANQSQLFQLFTRLAYTFAETDRLDFLVAQAPSLPQGPWSPMVGMLVGSYLSRYEPEAVATALETMPEPARRHILRSFAQELARANATAALAWAQTLEGNERTTALVSVGHVWRDAAQSGEIIAWVDGQPARPERDTVLHGLLGLGSNPNWIMN